jgi:phosphohistidine phosphatase SixA
MEAPAITRYRRPFFAPLWLTLLAAVVIAALCVALYRSAGTTVVLLMRPAEKDPGTIADPPISPEGEARAERLARLLGDTAPGAELDAIYVSDDRRAQQTAAPLAERLHHKPTVFAGADAAALEARVLRDHFRGTVLVIAAGPSFTQLLRAFGGIEPPPAAPDDADSIYVLCIPTFGAARLLRLRL